MSDREVVIIDSVRTGLAKSFRGSFNLTRPDDMAAHCVKALLERNPKVAPDIFDDCVVGAGFPEGPQGMNVGRVIAILAGLPTTVPGLTINRFCSSGLNAIAIAAQQIHSGFSDAILAGGVESITMTQNDMNMKNLPNPKIMETKPAIYMPMGHTAEVVAKRYGVTRDSQDEYALLSQQRVAKAQAEGLFKDEISPMKATYLKKDKASGTESKVETTVDKDECNRADTTLDGLKSLPPAFDPQGTVTAGNASQFSDGASMSIVMSAARAKELGLQPMGIFRGFAMAACEPDEMGIGPVFAIPKLLDRAGLKLADIDHIELNEAFASQVVYCRDKLGLDPAKLNPNGGSISIGHPYGMSGARLTGHLLRELKRKNQRYGIVTMCVGGGQGAAGLFERA